MPTPALELDEVPQLLSARAALKQGQIEDALKHYVAAAQWHPRNLRVKIEFAATLGQTHQTEAALDQLARAAKIGGTDPGVASELAKAYARLYRMDLAVEALQAIPGPERPAPIRAALAVYLEQLGRFDEAEAEVSAALDEAPEQPEPMLVLSRILGHVGKSQASLEAARAALQHAPENAALARVRGLYQVAEISDRLGNYAEAVAAVEQAKAIQRNLPAAKTAARAFVAQLDQLGALYERLDARTIRRWADESLPPLPNDVQPTHLLGSPRSGTTLLEQPLSAHPDLCVSSERLVFPSVILPQMIRPRNLGDDGLNAVDRLEHDELVRMRKQYVQALSATHASGAIHGAHVDKKPANLFHLYGLFRLLPESRFIIAIRDPRDVVISNYLRYFGVTDMSSLYMTWGETVRVYTRLMGIWIKMRERLDDSQWLEVRYEDSCDDIVENANRVFRFLGLMSHENVNDYLTQTRNTYVHSPTFAEVRQPVHRKRLNRWHNYAEHIEPLIDHLRPFIKGLSYA